MKRWWAAAFLLLPATIVLGQTPVWSTGDYIYDGAGNISQIGTDVYSYDSAGRLVRGTAGTGRDQTYSYDSFGNITRKVTDGSTGSAMVPSMDTPKNRLAATLATGTTAMGVYDGAGNMTSYQNSLYLYGYDGLNMLKEFQGNGQHELYVYTADNERIAAITLAGSTPTSYRWTIRGLDQKVLRQFDQTGSLWSWKEDYVYANGELLAAETSAPDHTLHFFTDHLGTPRLITGSGGAVISRHTYYPFGEEATSTAQDSERLKFTGHERDSTLDYMHARFANMSLGRFLSVDPTLDVQTALQAPQTWNRYAYARNNPLRFTDPDGKIAIADDVVIGAVVGVVILTAYVQAPSVAVPGKTNGQVLVQSAIGGFQALGRAVGSLIPGRQPTRLPPPPPPTTPSRPSTSGTQATTGVNPATPIQASSERNPAQDKLLTNGDIKTLQNAGHDIHELKGGDNASKYDLYKDTAGNVYVKPKGGKGPGEETGINVKDLQKP